MDTDRAQMHGEIIDDYLQTMSVEDVQDLLEKKKIAEEQANTPQPLENPNFDKIIEACQNHIAYFSSGDYHEDNDEAQGIYEVVMQAVYGDNIFVDWINKRM